MNDLVTTGMDFLDHYGDVLKNGAVVIGLLGSPVVIFWKALKSAVVRAKDKLFLRIRVCTISDAGSSRLDEFIDLYQRIFSAEERISTKEIHDWLRWKAEHEGIQYRLYLALVDENPVGVAISFFETSTKLLFIPYFGVSDLDSDWATTRRVVRAIARAVSREARRWKAGLVEIADPAEAGISREESRRRLARIRRLSGLAASEDLSMGLLELPYVQPCFSNDVDQMDVCGMLLFVLLKEKHRASLSRDAVLECLEFIYQRIYRPSFSGTPDATAAFELDLRARLAAFKENLSDAVTLRA